MIPTHTGRRINPLAPRVEDICIEDIAHGLSNSIRWTGQGRSLSTAQHSVMVARLCQTRHPGDLVLARKALIHDASDAYLWDIPTTLRDSDLGRMIEKYEKPLMDVICQFLGLGPWEMPSEVEAIDQEVGDMEYPGIFDRFPAEFRPARLHVLDVWPQGGARDMFMSKYHELFGGR